MVALNRKMVLPLFSTMKVCGQRAASGRGGSPWALMQTGLGGSCWRRALEPRFRGGAGRREGLQESEGWGKQHLPQVSGPSLGHHSWSGMRSSLAECQGWVGFSLCTFRVPVPARRGLSPSQPSCCHSRDPGDASPSPSPFSPLPPAPAWRGFPPGTGERQD